MEKIATITFHWATNYGAVLQAYALQQHLLESNYQAEIINYIPSRVKFLQTIMSVMKKDFASLKKEKRIKEFRKNELIVTSKKYGTNKALHKCANKYDAVICGSDQVWNEAFTLTAEGKPTLSYYLDFAGEKTRKIAYAVSFGTPKLRNQVKELITPQVSTFKSISVRENTGKTILEDIGVESTIVVDPTLLLTRKNYEALLEKRKAPATSKVFSYIIQKNQTNAEKTSKYISTKFNEVPNENVYGVDCGIYDWLYNIKNSEFVVTNSFHGMVFSIIFNKPFVAVAVENSGMNDRIYTLLSALGLNNRIVEIYDESLIDNIINTDIDWGETEQKLDLLRKSSAKFLMEALKDED